MYCSDKSAFSKMVLYLTLGSHWPRIEMQGTHTHCARRLDRRSRRTPTLFSKGSPKCSIFTPDDTIEGLAKLRSPSDNLS